MSQSSSAAPCTHCRGGEFDPKVAVTRLHKKYNELADVMAAYMSQAGLERPARAANAAVMATVVERIVGGTVTEPGTFPECCLLGHSSTNGGKDWFCSGVLIHPRIVISAAHCHQPPSPVVNVVAMKADSIAKLGTAEVISTKRSRAHPDYALTHTVNDISVHILRKASAVAPTPLATQAEIAAATETTLVGFGNDDVNSTRGFGVKRKVTVPITNIRRTPQDDLDAAEETEGFESDLEFTAGGVGFDSCNGDSGGPAYITVNGVRKVAGLTSRATRTAQHNCGDGGIYTRVDVHRDFIRQVAAAAGVHL